jgi:ABC-2 type transport system ATP-binding protein
MAGKSTQTVDGDDVGNQQRVQLAAALVFAPEILILDEPFAGLDPVAMDMMSAVLREQADAGIPVLFSSHQLDLVERLCDRVGIIRSGRMVACGAVAELRRGGTERLWVDAPQAPAGWAQRLPGATVLRTEGSRTLLALEAPGDDQAVLRAALETGPVREFRRDVPSLSEVYRHVVTEQGTA